MDTGGLHGGSGFSLRPLRISAKGMDAWKTALNLVIALDSVLVKNALQLFGVSGLGESNSQKDTRFLWIECVRDHEVALVIVHFVVPGNSSAPHPGAADDQNPFGPGICQRLFGQCRCIAVADARGN